MTTRLELRTAARRGLEDTSATPLWDDATLDGFLDEAMRHYGVCFPREATTTVPITAGASRIAVTTIEPEQIRRIVDADGVLVPQQAGVDPHGSPVTATAQAWRWWNSTLTLNQPASADGDWTIEHVSVRSLPDDDITDADIIPGDEEIVVQLAIAAALRRRAVEDGKRGLGRSGNPIASAAIQAASRANGLISARRRHVRGGWLGMS